MLPDATMRSLAIAQFWQFNLVFLMLGGVALLISRSRPHLAYALWLIVLIKAITPPLWSSNLSVFGHLESVAWHSSAQVEVTTIVADTAPPAQPSSVNRQNTETPTEAAIQADGWQSIESWLLAVWACGVIMMLGLTATTVVVRQHALRRCGVKPIPELKLAFSELKENLEVFSPVRLVITTDNTGPALCGIWKPKILLPKSLVAEMTTKALQPILVHELVHLRRWDHLVAVLQCVAQIVWWFHPLMWITNAAIVRVRERCCDLESVAALSGEAARYAHCLLDVLGAKANLRQVYGLPGVRPVDITKQRVKEIMEMRTLSLARPTLATMAAVLLVSLIVLPGALTRQSEATADEPATEQPEKKPKGRDQLLLKYGDGSEDGKKSIAGAGEMIRFEAPGDDAKIKAVRVHGARYGYPQPPQEDIEVSILSDDMSEVLHTELVPYSLFKRVAKNRWTHLPFREPVAVPKTFWVVLNFNAERTKGVYVSYDTSTKGEYSRIGLSEEDAKKTDFGGDWMVQVLLAE